MERNQLTIPHMHMYTQAHTHKRTHAQIPTDSGACFRFFPRKTHALKSTLSMPATTVHEEPELEGKMDKKRGALLETRTHAYTHTLTNAHRRARSPARTRHRHTQLALGSIGKSAHACETSTIVAALKQFQAVRSLFGSPSWLEAKNGDKITWALPANTSEIGRAHV